MATAKTNWRGMRTAAFVMLLAAAGAAWAYHDELVGYGEAGTAYGAKNACSCRYIAGRDLDSCETDFVPGMEAVFLSDDQDEQAVTAWVPLVSATTARYRDGFGCVLEPWEG